MRLLSLGSLTVLLLVGLASPILAQPQQIAVQAAPECELIDLTTFPPSIHPHLQCVVHFECPIVVFLTNPLTYGVHPECIPGRP